MRLSDSQKEVVLAMSSGNLLKSHRQLNGTKLFKLHTLGGQPVTIPRKTVERLRRQGLIDSNKKFPVSTFWLTDRGRAWMATQEARAK